jgi:outer membrane protein OmpA-like peptidoglycan-associated protein
MKLRSALLASAMMALPMAAAKAQAVNGPYIGGGLGVNLMQREDISIGKPVSASGDVRVNIGPIAVMSLGWGFGNGLRAEIEGDYRQNNGFSDPQGYGFPGSASGREQKAGGMVNVLYDFVGMTPIVQPYIGAGVGYQDQIWQGVGATVLNGAGASAQTSGRASFGYQAIVGLAVPIASAPGLAFTAEYRFLGLAGNRSYGPALPGGPEFTSSNDYNHSIVFGLRYAFGVAPVPAPAPTPVAEVGAKTFLVFFDWDKADLTARSEGIVRDAAAYSTHAQYTRIDVNGNTDTSGTPQYNMGLSERRARVVAAELVRDGVPQNAIDMHAYGDTHLLVPTGPGVREPQNRRVEIVYH